MKTRRLKAFALSLGLAALLLTATNLNAQSKHGGLFGKSSKSESAQGGMMQKSGGSTISDEGGPFTNANFGSLAGLPRECLTASGAFSELPRTSQTTSAASRGSRESV